MCTMHRGSYTHATPKPLCPGKFYIRCMFDPTEMDILMGDKKMKQSMKKTVRQYSVWLFLGTMLQRGHVNN